MKELFKVLLIFIVVIFLMSACTTVDTTTSTPTTGTGTTTTQMTTTTTQETSVDTEGPVDFPLQEKIVIKHLSKDHWGEKEYANNLSVQYLMEKTNMTFEYDLVAPDGWDIRVNLVLATQDYPDIIYHGNPIDLRNETHTAVLANFLDYQQYLPDFIKYLKEEASEAALKSLAGMMPKAGELYTFACIYEEATTYSVSNMTYRFDVFQKMGLTYETWDDLIECMKAIKMEYPNSYPFSAIKGWLDYTGPASFRSGETIKGGVYYNTDKNEYVFGPAEDTYKEFVTTMARMQTEGLLHPNMFTGDADVLKEDLSKESVFLGYWPKGVVRAAEAFGEDMAASYYNEGEKIGHYKDEDLAAGKKVLVGMLTPKNSKGEIGYSTWRQGIIYEDGYLFKSSKYIREILSLYNLTYLDDEVDVNTYILGKYGLTWEYQDGRPRVKSFIKRSYNPDAQLTMDEWCKQNGYLYLPTGALWYGVGPNRNGTEIAGVALTGDYWNDIVYNVKPFYDSGAARMFPAPAVVMDNQTSQKATQLQTALTTYIQEETIKFILGRRSMDEYDAFVQTCMGMGVDELISIYKNNYFLFTPDDIWK